MIALGKVLRPYGLNGEFFVSLLTSDPARLQEVRRFFVGHDTEEKEPIEFSLEEIRVMNTRVVVKLGGVHTPEAVKQLGGQLLMIPDEEVAPLPPGEFYEFQIVGCRVESLDGRFLGKVVEVIPMHAHDIYVVEDGDKRWWLPAAKAFIQEIDISTKRIRIELIDGLLETGPPG